MSDLCYRELEGWIELTDSIDHAELAFGDFWNALASRDLERAWNLLDRAWMYGSVIPFSLPSDIQAVQVPDMIRGAGSRYRVWAHYPDLAGPERGRRRQDWIPGS